MNFGKRLTSVLLAAVMSVGMAVPAMAAYPTEEEARACYSLSNSVEEETGGYDVYVETPEPFRLGDCDPELPYEEWYDFGNGDYKFSEYNGYSAIRPDTLFTLKNTAPKGKNIYLTASMQCYVDKYYGEDTTDYSQYYSPFVNGVSGDFSDDPIITLEEGTYVYLETVGYQLAQNGFEPSYTGEWIEIQPGETATFDFNKDFDTLGFGYDLHQPDGNNMYKLTVSVHFPDQQYRWWFQYIFHNDEESIDNFVAPEIINDPEIYFTEGEQLDSGVGYTYELKNNGETDIEAYYALMTYDAETLGALQIHPMDVKLAPGETYTGKFSSAYWGISNNKVCWLAFDDAAERDAFFADDALYSDDFSNSRYVLYDTVDVAAWLNHLQNSAEK